MFVTFQLVLPAVATWMASLAGVSAAERPSAENAAAEIAWQTDYNESVKIAKERGKMMFVFFYEPEGDGLDDLFESTVLSQPAIAERLKGFVCTKLPLQTKITIRGEEEEEVLLKHPAFEEMLGKPGMAILDFSRSDTKLDGAVVSTFPITKKLQYTPKQTAIILDLPPGTLTQRTLIYAVRIHPDKPASTNGQVDQILMTEAERHSKYQARIRRQGHHYWGSRFHRINTRLPGGLTAREVCAESWPGESLVEAAIECVRCWRFSSGHWSAVRTRHRIYGYDMKRGRNRIWYATGIFGRR